MEAAVAARGVAAEEHRRFRGLLLSPLLGANVMKSP